jgi:hypothetical protein
LSISKLQKRLNELGYCCPYGYFLSSRFDPVVKVGLECGLADRTVRWYRQRILTGECQCAGYCRSSSVNPSSTSLPT